MPGVLILAIILFGMGIGAIAQLLLGKGGRGFDWGLALAAGLIGSLRRRALFSLIAGDGFASRPSGVIGSIIGAVLVTLAWRWWQRRNAVTAAPARRR